MLPKRLLFATRNKDKIVEFSNLFSDLNIDLLSALDFPNIPEVEEDQSTLTENAIKKARELYHQTQIPTVADDTGLEVDFLGGAPGVFSSRFAGENATYQENIDKLLVELNGVPQNQRGAKFRTVLAFCNNNNMITIEGSCQGQILASRKGKGGFGYDPVFFVPELGKTLAEIDTTEKNRISHRGKALRQFRQYLLSELS